MLMSLNLSSFSFEMLKIQVPQGAVTPESRVHPVNIIGDSKKELVIVRRNEVAVYQFKGDGYAPLQRFLLPAGSGTEGHRIYYGFATLTSGAPKSLVVLTPSALLYYPIEGEAISSPPRAFYQGDLAKGEGAGSPVQYYDLALDLNSDGVDELLLPEETGFSILHQSEKGDYRKVPLPRSPYDRHQSYQFTSDVLRDPARPEFFTASVSQRRGVDDLLFFDADGDKLQDLIYSSTAVTKDGLEVERYDVFLQKRGMLFENSPGQSLAIPYDSTAQSTFRDVNNDRRLDAILVRSNLDLVNPRTIVKFFIGKNQKSQVFTRETDRFVTKDPLGIVRVADFNSDGMIDFAMTFFSYQMGSVEDIVDLALANKIRFKLQFYLGRGARGFSRQPDSEKEITLETRLEDFRGNPPVMLVEDFNSDNVMDLAVRSREDRLELFPSMGELKFGQKSAQVLSVPADAHVLFEDLNADGQADLLVSLAPQEILNIYVAAN